MLSHRRLAAWYVQLAQQLEAGLPLTTALRSPGTPAVVADAMARRIEAGGSVDEALQSADGRMPLADQLALSAAADAGRLPHTLRNLAARHAQVATVTWRIALACAYPLGVLHVGLLLAPVASMIDWDQGFHWSAAHYLRGIAITLVPLWLLITSVIVLARRQSPFLARTVRALPVFGAYARAQALADFCFALGNFLEAGVPIGKAWAASGLTSSSPQLKVAAEAIADSVDRGSAPGGQLAAWPCFPADFVARYRTGEITGQLEAALAELSAQYQESAQRALTVATLLYPALMFLVVAAGVVYFVVTLYAGYLKMITKLAS